ncbi:osmotically inducible protein OsmC [bacterium]|nr:osmotically inducible protein OsmC [bacterium]
MATKKAIVKHINGITFLGKADSNHWVTMDGPEEFGGSNAGTRPKELLLIALGGCTGSDIATILKKKKIKIDGFEMNISADVQETHPQVYTKIHLEYVLYGEEIPKEAVERAIELSQKSYCSVTAMLQKAVEIKHSYRIEKQIN